MHCQIIPRTSLQPSAHSALGAAMAAVLQMPVPCEGCQGWGQRCPSRGMHRGRCQSISEWDKSSKTDSKRIGHALLFLCSFCFLPTSVKRCVSLFQPSFSRLGRSQLSSHRMRYWLYLIVWFGICNPATLLTEVVCTPNHYNFSTNTSRQVGNVTIGNMVTLCCLRWWYTFICWNHMYLQHID